ncbi:alpha-amlyase [Fictibacillus aquaticus]|uniref:alpha-amylase n=2 Tax=Fictibacillus aquaticus TaxID=2021314 RepID=A0A235FGG7_9BACL|nr:alpha-amlyase [Fictibacillus aquaticus]
MLLPFLLFFSSEMNALAEEEKERNWQDEAVYFIMVDRFYNGDTSNDLDSDIEDPYAYHGGDIKGITKKLDYIKDLGSTAIWLTPIVKNEEKGYHGYWTEDFLQVEEHFGTIQDVKELVKEAHKREMKVILDLVVNHTGYKHEWLNDPDKKGWYHEQQEIYDYNDQKQVEEGWLSGLPDLNQENESTRKYLLDMAVYWIKETNIDGYRLDTVKHVPKSFWSDFSKAVKKEKPDFYLLGEVWHDNPEYIADYSEAGIESFVDYPLYNEMTLAFSESGQPLSELASVWDRNSYYYSKPYEMGNFLDNHDNIRFTRQALLKNEDPEKRLRLALTYLYTAPGIPILYQGTEHMMDGGKDPDNRHMMEFPSENKMEDFTSEIAKLRQEQPALRRGDYKLVYEKGSTIVFKRKFKGDIVYIAYNNSKEKQSITLKDRDLKGYGSLNSLITSAAEVNADVSKGSAKLNMPPETAQVLSPMKGSSIPLWAWLTGGAAVAVIIAAAVMRHRKLSQ